MIYRSSYRYIIFTILVIAFSLPMSAQEVGKFEGGISAGITIPASGFHHGSYEVGPDFGIEFRYNIPTTKWDVGAEFNLSTTLYGFSGYSSYYEEFYTHTQSNRSLSILAAGHYNFRQGMKVNPFAGMGVGMSILDAIYEVSYPHSGINVCFRPEIGCEFFSFLRLMLFSDLIPKRGYSNFGISIGVAFGGRPSKHL